MTFAILRSVIRTVPKISQKYNFINNNNITDTLLLDNSKQYLYGNKLAKSQLWTSVCLPSASSAALRHDAIQTLTKVQAQDLVLRLTADERKLLLTALQEYESKLIKDEYEGQLAASRWRSKFGRPSKLPTLGDVDPTGTYCPIKEDWLMRKLAETVPKPTTKDLWDLAICNAVPFIGFGFLDNFIMLVAGDYIDLHLGSYLMISTMAAAALGNTFSDLLGIGSAYYVERAATRIGVKAPNLTPIQLDMTSSRWSANIGRAIGVTIGCLLGMIPLLFLTQKSELEKEKEKEEKNTQTVDVAVSTAEN